MTEEPTAEEPTAESMGTPDAEVAAILLAHGRPTEVQVTSWVVAILPERRVEKLIRAYANSLDRESRLEDVIRELDPERAEQRIRAAWKVP